MFSSRLYIWGSLLENGLDNTLDESNILDSHIVGSRNTFNKSFEGNRSKSYSNYDNDFLDK